MRALRAVAEGADPMKTPKRTRDLQGRWLPGASGNPWGRPKGARGKRVILRGKLSRVALGDRMGLQDEIMQAAWRFMRSCENPTQRDLELMSDFVTALSGSIVELVKEERRRGGQKGE
jgi:hypothetical protein